MQQSINLYALLPRHAKFALTYDQMISIYCVFIAFLLMASLSTLWQQHEKKIQLTTKTIELEQTQQQFADLLSRYPTLNPSDLDVSLKSLEQGLAIKTKMVALLSQSQGFSDYLTALGKAIVPGVWLTEINVSGVTIVIKGNALRSSAVQEFIQQMKTQPIFAGIPITLQDLSEINDKATGNEILTFTLSTKVA